MVCGKKKMNAYVFVTVLPTIRRIDVDYGTKLPYVYISYEST